MIGGRFFSASRVSKLVEEGAPGGLFTNPLHPYTKALISASLPAHPRQQHEEIVLTGEVPSPLNPPSGCAFHRRCPFVLDVCSQGSPVNLELTPGHQVTCHLYPERQAAAAALAQV